MKNADIWKLAAEVADESGEDGALWVPPDIDTNPGGEKPWYPDLNPTQKLIFEDTESMVVMAGGEKGSGKTFGVSHAGVRHCYEHSNALWLIICITISTGAEGILHFLENRILPAWKNGNKFPEWENGEPHPRRGEYADNGIGLYYLPTKLDPLTKDRHIWILAKDGGWSKIWLKSIPHASQVQARMYGPEPSRIHVEELTECDGPEYFDHTSVQLNRRPGVFCTQQWTASMNPKGTSHWVYQRLVSKTEHGVGDGEDYDSRIKYYHVPISENLARMSPLYADQVSMSIKNPYERRRLLDGEWVDMPAGDAIFKDYYAPEIHVRGTYDLKSNKWSGILPIPGFPIIVGHDPGPKNYSIHLEQRIPTIKPEKPLVWLVFDELNFVGRKTPYEVVVRRLIDRLKYWMNHRTAGYNYRMIHIADEEAFTQVKSNGSYDAQDIQKHAKRFGMPFRMLAAPKGADTVPQRVSMLIDYLLYEIILISGICEKTIDMLRLLPSKPTKDGEFDPYQGLVPQKSIHKHSMDSLTYPMWKFQVKPGRATTDEVQKQRMFTAGSGRIS